MANPDWGRAVMAHAVLVTGAAGLVGRAVVEALTRQGHEVQAVVRTPSGLPGELIADLARVDSAQLLAMTPRPPKTVVHLAAAVPHWNHYPDTEQSAQITRAIDRTVMATTETVGARLIYASSCGLYDPADPSLKLETSGTLARSAYFQAKLEGEAVAERLSATILRLSAPFGRGLPPNLVLSRFLALARDDKDLQLWGSGAREQDFLSTADIARAVVAAMDRPVQGVFNIAAGAPMTMKALAQLVTETIGTGRIVMTGTPDPLDGLTARYCIDKALRALDWAPSCPLRDWLAGVPAKAAR